LKEHLRGSNRRIASTSSMVKTTPPGTGSRLLRLTEDNPISAHFERRFQGVRLMATGPFEESDLGTACYHSKVGAVELLLNHLIDEPGEYVVVDMTAGADSFASGMFTKFDVTFLVVEPTLRGVAVYRQCQQYARDWEVRISVIGNKVEDQADLDFLRREVGSDLLSWVGRSAFVRASEKGRTLPLSELEPPNRVALKAIRRATDEAPKDWDRQYRQTVELHLRNGNARRWASAATGDLSMQVDPDFVLQPDLLPSGVRPHVAAVRLRADREPGGPPSGGRRRVRGQPDPAAGRAGQGPVAPRDGERRHPGRAGGTLRRASGLPELPPRGRLPP
jgi:CO dehydrogenase maturation factor